MPYITPNTNEYIIQAKIKTPASGSNKFEIILRRQDANNYVMFGNRNGQFNLDKVVNGSLTNLKVIGGAWAADTVFDLTCQVSPNFIRVRRDNTNNDWVSTDTTFNTYPCAGLGTPFGNNGGTNPSPTFLEFAVYPRTLTLPIELRSGQTPTVLTGGTILAKDLFAGAAATSLDAHMPDIGPAWSLVGAHGTWALDGTGKVGGTNPDGIRIFALQDLGVNAAECSVNVTFPADATNVVAGIANYTDDTHYFTGWFIRIDSEQPGFQEIENRHTYDGFNGGVCHKVGLGAFIVAGETHNIKIQFTAGILHEYVDGILLNSYVSPVPWGTKFGLILSNYATHNDNGSLFSNWIVKAL